MRIANNVDSRLMLLHDDFNVFHHHISLFETRGERRVPREFINHIDSGARVRLEINVTMNSEPKVDMFPFYGIFLVINFAFMFYS